MRVRLVPLIIFSVLLPLGCADEVDNVEPRDGLWNYYGDPVENNTCPNEFVLANADTVMTIDYNGGTSFDIEQEDMEDIDCGIDGNDFVCPDVLASEIPVDALNLTLQIYVRVEGDFQSEVEATGEQQIRIECEGEGCGAVSDTYPCAYDLPFEATAQL